MFSWALVVIVAIVVAVGQVLLFRSAWRFRRRLVDLPAGIPRSDPRGDLGWTLLTALGTLVFLSFVVQSLL
ncbi:MAG: hypothetical protein HGA65_21055 [Oscillochloris sp.]|nr:hypothetical protein [Oscillochloris sp.]